MSEATAAEPQARPKKQEQEPASSEITEVAEGILRLQLPISMPGLGHVNCYALEDKRGWTIVDPGLPGPESLAVLEARLADLGTSPRQVHTVIVTHSHPDHFGGAPAVVKASGADVVTHESFIQRWQPDDPDVELAAAGPPASIFGVIPEGAPTGAEIQRIVDDLRQQAMGFVRRSGIELPEPTIRLEDTQVRTLGGREWVAVHTPGHTPDHLCLFDPAGGVLLSGDHVLPTITPHISGLASGEDPLARFFDSLQRVSELPGVRHVLPAHGHPFTDVAARASAIHRHHLERLATLHEIMEASGPSTVEALSHQLFAPRSWGSMAESETFAHLEHLRLGGQADFAEQEGRLLYAAK
jgi:glyoxylase-like metal-dependent hydrolase (beta-lactamase superfamily II)